MMILFPREKPIIENLNSYYVDIEKVFEHYQGQMTSGAVHFKAPSMEGVVFFDEAEPLRGVVKTTQGVVHGKAAAQQLIEAVSKINFTLGVFEIPPEKIFFWTHLPDARPIYDNLSADFTDLDGLVKKMKSERLTGVIDVRGSEGDPSGIILFENGDVLDICSPLIDSVISGTGDRLAALISATRNGGTTFSVRQLQPVVDSDDGSPGAPDFEDDGDADYLMLEELLDIFERAVASLRKDFTSLFRRRCIDNADRFDFLDPFVGEFAYIDKRITFSGGADEGTLTRGLFTVLTELGEDLNISDQVRHAINSWAGRWGSRLDRYNIQP